MAGTINKAIIVGRLGLDPKISYTTSGNAVANLSVATDERYKDKSGQWQSQTEWHRVVVFGQQAEFCANYLTKGSLVGIDGRIQTRKWQDQQGQDRYTTEIVAQRVQGLEGRQRDESHGGGRPQQNQGPRPQQNQNQNQNQNYNQNQGQQGPSDDEDLGPAFPSEASGMDDVPF